MSSFCHRHRLYFWDKAEGKKPLFCYIGSSELGLHGLKYNVLRRKTSKVGNSMAHGAKISNVENNIFFS